MSLPFVGATPASQAAARELTQMLPFLDLDFPCPGDECPCGDGETLDENGICWLCANDPYWEEHDERCGRRRAMQP